MLLQNLVVVVLMMLLVIVRVVVVVVVVVTIRAGGWAHVEKTRLSISIFPI